MFVVVSQFKQLFLLRSIKQLMGEAQQRILGAVKEELASLERKKVSPYQATASSVFARSRGYTRELGLIIWRLQLLYRARYLRRRVEDVFPPETRKEECNSLLNYIHAMEQSLDKKSLLIMWQEEWLKRLDGYEPGRMLCVVRQQRRMSAGAGGSALDEWVDIPASQVKPGTPMEPGNERIVLRAEYNPLINVLLKEYHTVLSLHFGELAPSLNFYIKSGENSSRLSMALASALSSYHQSMRRVDANPRWWPLLALAAKPVQEILASVSKQLYQTVPSWIDNMHVTLLKLWESTESLEKHVTTLEQHEAMVQEYLNTLSRCEYHPDELNAVISALRDSFNRLRQGGFGNVDAYAEEVHKDVEAILARRLTQALEGWVNAFVKSWRKGADRPGFLMEWEQARQSKGKSKGEPSSSAAEPETKEGEDVDMEDGSVKGRSRASSTSGSAAVASQAIAPIRLRLPRTTITMKLHNRSIQLQPSIDQVMTNTCYPAPATVYSPLLASPARPECFGLINWLACRKWWPASLHYET